MGTNAKWLRALLKSNVLAMGCWGSDGELTAKNEALVRLIGYSKKELAAGNIRMRDITPPEYRPLDQLALKEVQAKGECTPFEKEIIRKDGRRIPVLVGGSSFGDDVTEGGAFFLVDLRERKRAVTDSKRLIQPELLSLTDRQRVICLLLSYGESEKRAARLLDLGLRTVELDKHRAARQLGIPISRVVVWSVENRHGLVATIRDFSLVPEEAAKIIRRACGAKTSKG